MGRIIGILKCGIPILGVINFLKSVFKTGFVQKPIFLIALNSATLLFSFGCKPQKVITESIVSQSNDSTILQLKDSLHIREMQIATLKSELKSVRRENINLRSETVRYEINYDTGTAVDSITKRPVVKSESYMVNKTLYEERLQEFKSLLKKSLIENRNLAVLNSKLKLHNERLKSENMQLKKASSDRSGNKKKIVIAILVLFFAIIYRTNI
jgi:regulator of replication initiation timing